MSIAYTNGKIFTGQKTEIGKAVLTDEGRITDIVAASAIPAQYKIEDLQGATLAPALIDMQIYGGNGKMFSHELSVEALQATYEYCLSGGCAWFMVTMATNTIEKFVQAFDVVREYWKQGGKGLLGLHLEGPYINPVKRGAHIEACIKKPTLEEVQMLLDKGKDVFVMMTLAPEQCDDEVIQTLIRNDIIVSAGHTNANYQQAMHGFDLGIPVATHLFNAMSALQHREPGMVGALFNHPTARCSIVCDGIHVDYNAVRIAKKLMKDRLFFITDAVAETTTGEYQHLFRGDRYSLPDGTLSGSALTMMQCVRNAVERVEIPLDEALRMATLYPAKLLGKQYLIGSIKKRYAASFVIIDSDLQIRKVIS